ncbi:MAG: SPFH domain-containing protein [Pyramidobacter sp.]|uniref:SPFH domain-containing protein n=1 Tax=Pyramidobacter sp. TaxID=1943581 RepID=UPI002A80AC24|nr:SPFH domain-containing protein [Pyramidobacter sp.]MDY4033468.1 SPFH domain-containing protein [Pyramidobacter sp.]
MGLFKAIGGAMGDVLSDQWREYFSCDAMDRDVLVERGYKRKGKRGGNNKGGDNIISNGSIISVADGQCMIVVDQGKVVELCAEPGEFVYDTSSEPSIFYGGLGHGLKESFKTIGKRISFGGEAPKEQRVYYFNTKEIMGNRYGTANPVPFRVVDNNIGLDIDIAIRCNGEYSYRITNPMLFYTNVCGNVNEVYTRDQIDSQLKTELLTALQPAFARLSEQGIRYSSLPAHTMEMAKALNDILSEQWGALRGIEIVAFGVNSVKASEEDEKMIKEMQRSAVLRNPNMMAAHLGQAQADAMRAAASNTATGPMFAFAGMNMASQAGGMNAANLFAMGAQQQNASPAPQAAKPARAPVSAGWKCGTCGHDGNRGKFCSECGAPQPAPASAEGWTCPTCGHVNKGKFCPECGARKPAGEPLYRCDKCGWEPKDPHHPPKFCPECGDPFDENDNVAK